MKASVKVTTPSRRMVNPDLLPEFDNALHDSASYDVEDESRLVELTANDAATKIQTVWMTYRHVKVFKALRALMDATERQLSEDVLAFWHPQEAQLLADPCLDARIKLRLGGGTFPPIILFKVFTRGKVTLLSGHTVFTPGSDAARQACAGMGKRRFMNMVIEDTQRSSILDTHSVILPPHRADGSVHVLDRKGYLRMNANIDIERASHGGRANGWRPLFAGKHGPESLPPDLKDALGISPPFAGVSTGATPREDVGAYGTSQPRLANAGTRRRKRLSKTDRAKRLVQRMMAAKEESERERLAEEAATALVDADLERVAAVSGDVGRANAVNAPLSPAVKDTVFMTAYESPVAKVPPSPAVDAATTQGVTGVILDTPRTPIVRDGIAAEEVATPTAGGGGMDEADLLFEWAQELSFAKYNMVWEDF